MNSGTLLMAESAALANPLRTGAADLSVRAIGGALSIRFTHRIGEVEADWHRLEAGGVESPGQSFDFIRRWAEAFAIPEAARLFVVAADDGEPVALMALQRRWDKGVRVLSWFPGSHVGCNAPLADLRRLRAMTPAERRRLWRDMLRGVPGADLVYLKSVPECLVDGVDVFAELGHAIEGDTLYRAEFSSFEDADRTQRNKSRRKHDRQQGDKLQGLGTVDFAELANGPEALAVLDTMFRQRAARFREMGIFNPFDIPVVRRFYDSTAGSDSGVPVRLHILRLDGKIVAMRYNIQHGDRLFCLISSMSDDPRVQHGSPGKQCLLRVMQTVFDEGYRVFDMGEGLTDEKRHWCNRQIPVRHHYLPITRRGELAASAHRQWQLARRRIKSDERLLDWAKTARSWMLRLSGKPIPTEVAATHNDE